MKNNIVFLSALFCASAYSMDNTVSIKEAFRSTDAEGKEIFTNQNGVPFENIGRCATIHDSVDYWDEGAYVLKKGNDYEVKVMMAIRNGSSGYLINKQVGPFDCIDGKEPNILLLKVPRINGKFLCDVLYRAKTGRVVATSLNSEQEIYGIDLVRAEGDHEEKLLQSANGDVVVVNKNGNAYTWSHQEMKEKLTKK